MPLTPPAALISSTANLGAVAGRIAVNSIVAGQRAYTADQQFAGASSFFRRGFRFFRGGFRFFCRGFTFLCGFFRLSGLLGRGAGAQAEAASWPKPG